MAVCIHQKREIELILCREFLMGFSIVQRNPENLCIVQSKTTRLITERADFNRSATPEIARIKGKHDVLFATELAQLARFAFAISCDKIGRRLVHLNSR